AELETWQLPLILPPTSCARATCGDARPSAATTKNAKHDAALLCRLCVDPFVTRSPVPRGHRPASRHPPDFNAPSRSADLTCPSHCRSTHAPVFPFNPFYRGEVNINV